MELRCKNCNKLFRVADEKITGSGVKFTCTRCNETVKITREDFEQYKMKSVAPALASVGSAPHGATTHAARTGAAAPKSADADFARFDLGEPAAAASAAHAEEKKAPVFVKPAPPAQNAAESTDSISLEKAFPLFTAETEHAASPKPASKMPPQKPVQPASIAPAAPVSAAASGIAKESHHPVPLVAAGARQPRSSGFGKKAAIFLVVLLLIGGAGFGVKFYMERSSSAGKSQHLSVPDGLQVQNAAGAIDPVSGDLVLTGAVLNTADSPKSAWLIVAEVYDAQGSVLIRAKFLNGKQLYTRRDYGIMTKRGINVQDLKQKNLQDQGIIIPAKGTANFEIRIMEPPVGVASFNALLQPFDPVQLYKEMAEEQK